MIWDKVEWYIQQAVERYGDYCTEDILECLCNKSMQLWTWQTHHEIHAALITTIQTQDDDKYCLLVAVGGDSMSEWAPRLPIVEEWAKGEGCTEMQIYGRLGWARQLNYKIEYTKMTKGI